MVTYVSAESKWHPAPEVHGLVAGPVFTINSTGLAAALLVTQHRVYPQSVSSHTESCGSNNIESEVGPCMLHYP